MPWSFILDQRIQAVHFHGHESLQSDCVYLLEDTEEELVRCAGNQCRSLTLDSHRNLYIENFMEDYGGFMQKLALKSSFK